MSGRLQKSIHPGAAAAIVFLVVVIVQVAWWRGLVYRPRQTPPRAGGPSGGGAFGPKVLAGRSDVIVETLTGDLEPGAVDGPGHAAQFDRPTGLTIDTHGNIFVADCGNNRIRKVTPGGETTTVAGGSAGYRDGDASQAMFNAPCSVAAAPDGALFVADTGNSAIRRIDGAVVSTIVGARDASGRAAPGGFALMRPTGIAYAGGKSPSLVVADAGLKRVLTFRLDGTLLSQRDAPGAPVFVLPPPRQAVAVPQLGYIELQSATLRDIPVVDPAGGGSAGGLPVLHRPLCACPFGDDWLVTDGEHGAVFMVRNGAAEVVAGVATRGDPQFGERDGDGARCKFGTMCAVVASPPRYVYLADTTNNAIRRLTFTGGDIQ